MMSFEERKRKIVEAIERLNPDDHFTILIFENKQLDIIDNNELSHTILNIKALTNKVTAFDIAKGIFSFLLKQPDVYKSLETISELFVAGIEYYYSEERGEE